MVQFLKGKTIMPSVALPYSFLFAYQYQISFCSALIVALFFPIHRVPLILTAYSALTTINTWIEKKETFYFINR
jgi:hypothetical protein